MTPEQNKCTKNSPDGGQSNPHGMKKSKAVSDGIEYNKTNDIHTKEGDMPTNALQDLSDNARRHASEPILERKSDLFGYIRVYPPATEPTTWASHSWLLTTEFDGTKNPPGMSVKLKAECVMECYERPHFVFDYHKFVEPA